MTTEKRPAMGSFTDSGSEKGSARERQEGYSDDSHDYDNNYEEEEEEEASPQFHPSLTPEAWGELFVNRDYDFKKWGIRSPDAYFIDASIPLWRQPPDPHDWPEHSILLHEYVRASDPPDGRTTRVAKTVKALQQATVYVVGLASENKLNRFQTRVLLWKHVANLYRSCYSLATRTGRYSEFADILSELQRSEFEIVHPETGQTIEYVEPEDQRKSSFWRDLPGITSIIRDELDFISCPLGEGEKGLAPEPRRRDTALVLGLTCEIIARCRIENPYNGKGNKSVYLQAGKWFRAAFGRLTGWDWPYWIEPEAGRPPKPNEWEIRGACLWMIPLAGFFYAKIQENEEAMAKNPVLADDPWFPPWDHGDKEGYYYPGGDIYVDKNTHPYDAFDVERWREWTKANGLNEFTSRSWDAWGKGFVAVLDANRRGKYGRFAGGQKLSDSTEKLIMEAMEKMTEAKENYEDYSRFQEQVAVMSL